MPISSLELKHFLSAAFVECGSYCGDGIKSALIAGFDSVHSIEINTFNYEECSNIVGGDKRVHLYLGDCGKLLDKVLNDINAPCTIYADANGWVGEVESPFYSSIEALVRHNRKDHIILVDDINHGFRERQEILNDLRDSDMVRQLRRINSDYTLYLIDTHTENLVITYPSWVLVGDPIKNRFPNLAESEYV